MKKDIQLISPSQIPEAIDTPLEHLMRIYQLFLQMDQICDAEQGIGISAVQVGVPWRMFSVKWEDRFRHFVNCSYDPLVDPQARSLQTIEGCLSLKNLDGEFRQFMVDRYPKIRMVGFELISEPNLELQKIDFEVLHNTYRIVIQHEIDHGKGILISDIGREVEVL
jgi:peptide deformylase